MLTYAPAREETVANLQRAVAKVKYDGIAGTKPGT